jgi:hypothetical protein
MRSRRPFAAYDLETKHFVFESPVGGLLPGEILVANDDQLELSLSVFGGKIPLYFNRKDNGMRWPGLPAGELRRLSLAHACAGTADRTMLSTFDATNKIDLERRQPVDAFSLRCPGPDVYYFFTLDRATKTVVMETGGGLIWSGDIKGIVGHELRFTLGFYNTNLFDSVWDEESRVLTTIGIPNDPARPTKTYECTVIKARSVLELYGRLAQLYGH